MKIEKQHKKIVIVELEDWEAAALRRMIGRTSGKMRAECFGLNESESNAMSNLYDELVKPYENHD